MAFLEEMEKFGSKVLKGAKRRSKKASSEIEKTVEKGVKRAKGLASQAAEKIKPSSKSGTINRAEQSQLSQVDLSGVKAGKAYSSTPDRWRMK